MVRKYNPALDAALAAATDKNGWASSLAQALGTSRRIRIFHDVNGGADPFVTGVEVYNVGAAGALTASSGKVIGHGAIAGTTIRQAADLSIGTACLRIESGSNWLQYSIGLDSGKDIVLSANPSTTAGLSLAGLSLSAPAALPLTTGGDNPTPTPIGGLLATMSIANSAASPLSAGFIPQMFGHPFKKGDVPANAYPMFTTGAGNNCPYTMFNKTTWSDGSLRFASFLIRIPEAVAANGSVSVAVKATNAAPGSTSARTLADLSSAGADLNVAIVGADQLSGTWVSKLNQGVADNDDILLLGDGPVGKIWRIRQQFMQSGANHGQLECYWYVAALQDANGALYGLRHLARISQPWYNIDTPAKSFRSFSSMKLQNGASLIRECVQQHAVSASLPGPGPYLNATNHGLTDLRMVRLTGTTLPTGAAANTSYIAINTSANSLALKNPYTYADLSMGGTPSADLKLQALVYIPQFSSVFTAGSNGRWDFTQAGGSVAVDANVLTVHDKAYWMTTGVVPAYENITVNAQTAYPYEPNYMGPVVTGVNGTGERSDIGVMPSWHVNHLLSQSAAAEQTVRITGLAAANLPVQYYNSGTKTIIPVNAGTYAGMPASNVDFRGDPNNDYGFTKAASGPKIVGQDANDFSHKPALAYYAYLLTGEPQLLDLVLEIGWLAVANEYSPMQTITSVSQSGRNVTINGTEYYGVPSMRGSLREAAWATRDMAVAAALCPDVAPHCAAYKTYFNDVVATNYAALKNYFDNLAPAYQKQAGFVLFGNEFAFADMWMHGYYTMATAMVSKLLENAYAAEHLNMLAKWPGHVYTNCGLYYVPSFETMVRTDKNSGFVTSANSLLFYGLGVTYSSATNVLTYAQDAMTGYTVANGDVFMFDDGGRNGAPPSGLALQTRYYAVNATSTTFQLAGNLGGTVLVLGSSGTVNVFYRATTPPANKSISTDRGASVYHANVVGALKLAKAAGATVDTALIAALDAQNSGADYASEPKYRFADHF